MTSARTPATKVAPRLIHCSKAQHGFAVESSVDGEDSGGDPRSRSARSDPRSDLRPFTIPT
eukprot:13931701-Alexandrium_andersonii.AAC.1